jgi:hypothetical protein
MISESPTNNHNTRDPRETLAEHGARNVAITVSL